MALAVWALVVIAATAVINFVNFTDGLDGLVAARPSALADGLDGATGYGRWWARWLDS